LKENYCFLFIIWFKFKDTFEKGKIIKRKMVDRFDDGSANHIIFTGPWGNRNGIENIYFFTEEFKFAQILVTIFQYH